MSADRDLVRRLLVRDPGAARAFDALHERYAVHVRRHVLRMVRDAEAAEDLTQEAFLRIWTRAEQWDERGSFKSWLLRIATNLTLNYLRSRKRRPQQPLEPILPTWDVDDEADLAPSWLVDRASLGPEAALELSELRGAVTKLLNALPEEKREVLWLAQGADMSIGDIAEALDIPEGTVKSRLHYARRRLAEQWEVMKGEWEE